MGNMGTVKTVIDKARELVETEGKEAAIKFFEDRINSLSPPKDFGEVCKIAGAKTAIQWINGEIK